MTRVQREFRLECDASFRDFEIFPQQMAQAVVQIGQEWLQGNGGAILFYGFSIISFCRLKVAHQLMQAMRIWGCLVEPEISRGRQFFVATRAPIGCLSRISIRCRQSLKSLESVFIVSRF